MNEKRIMIACDFETKEELFTFLRPFGNEKLYLKIGMELFYREGRTLIEYLHAMGHHIFLDLKLHDIPNTVAQALHNLKDLHVDYITVHAAGGRAMLRAAVAALVDSPTKLLAVTILTSIDEPTLHNDLLITGAMSAVVSSYAKLASEEGVDGVICSPYEVKEIKAVVQDTSFECITPGIRLADDKHGDQSRVATPQFAFAQGANALVIGRSITSHEEAHVRYHAVVDSIAQIEESA
jgi:orotidine-5'-phosphate decarboxylase